MTAPASPCSRDGPLESVRAVGNLDALREAVDAQPTTEGGGAGGRGAARDDRHRPHPLGHARPRDRGERPPALRHRRPRPRRRQRDRRELRRARASSLADGAVFTSETDAEVIAHLISRQHDDGDLVEAVRARLRRARRPLRVRRDAPPTSPTCSSARARSARWSSAAATASSSSPPRIPAFLAHTRRVQYIEDGEIVVLRRRRRRVHRRADRRARRARGRRDRLGRRDRREGRLRDVHAQGDPRAGRRGRRDDRRPHGPRATASTSTTSARSTTRCCATCSGSSSSPAAPPTTPGLIGRYAIEEWARVPVEMDVASEYRYRNPVVGPGDLVIGITQSGETADTLAAMRLARERGAKVLAITNVMGSQATRDADGVLFTRAGLEIGVAATKTFVSQVAAMYLLALRLAELRGTLARGAPERAGRRAQAPAALHRRAARARRRDAIEPIAEAHYERGLLPLPGPPRRPAGRARGRAEAQGDLLHRHRRLRGRRDEARPDRAARRGHAGRRASRPTRRCSTRSSRTCRRSAPAART